MPGSIQSGHDGVIINPLVDDDNKILHLESTFMGTLEVRTTETMSKRIVIVIMFEKSDDEIGSFQIHSLHVHRFKEDGNSGLFCSCLLIRLFDKKL